MVARVNPFRFIKGEPPPLDELIATMTKRAKGLDPGKVRPEDLAPIRRRAGRRVRAPVADSRGPLM